MDVGPFVIERYKDEWIETAYMLGNTSLHELLVKVHEVDGAYRAYCEAGRDKVNPDDLIDVPY